MQQDSFVCTGRTIHVYMTRVYLELLRGFRGIHFTL